MKHRHFEVTTPGAHRVRICGDPAMAPETLDALMRLADLAYEHLSTVEVLHRHGPSICALCGAPITQKRKGRRRKYCDTCASKLGHRTPSPSLRKSGAEKATEPLAHGRSGE